MAAIFIDDAPPEWGRLNPHDFKGVTPAMHDRIKDLARRSICLRLPDVGKTDAQCPGFLPENRYCVRDLDYTIRSYRRGAYGRFAGQQLYVFPISVHGPPDWESFRTTISPKSYEDKVALYAVSGIRHV